MSTKPEFIIERISIKRNSVQVRYGCVVFICFTDRFPYISGPKHTRVNKPEWEKLIALIRDEWTRATYAGDTSKVQEDMPIAPKANGRVVPKRKVKK